jgi:hypothetical protein
VEWLQWKSSCLASVRPQYRKKNKEKDVHQQYGLGALANTLRKRN